MPSRRGLCRQSLGEYARARQPYVAAYIGAPGKPFFASLPATAVPIPIINPTATSGRRPDLITHINEYERTSSYNGTKHGAA